MLFLKHSMRMKPCNYYPVGIYAQDEGYVADGRRDEFLWGTA